MIHKYEYTDLRAAWTTGFLGASSSLSLGPVLCTSQGLYREDLTLSARYSTPMSDTSLVVCTVYRVCSLPWVQLMETPT